MAAKRKTGSVVSGQDPHSTGFRGGHVLKFTAKSAKNAKKELKLGALSGLCGSKNQVEV